MCVESDLRIAAPDEGLSLLPLNILSSYSLCGTLVFKSEIFAFAIYVCESGLYFEERNTSRIFGSQMLRELVSSKRS